jgi:hypothetical protein
MNRDVSDETLHAFIDGELDIPESERLIARMRTDAELSQRVCGLRSLQNLMKLAYSQPPSSSRAIRSRTRLERFAQRCALGCVIAAAGLGGGWALRGGFEAGAAAAAESDHFAGRYQAVSLMRQPDPARVILHLDSGAPERMLAVLDQADRLLDAAERQQRALQLEVIANSRGIDLLRAGVSPHAERVARMQQRHANLHWVACGQSLARFASEGEKVELLPSTRTAPTAIGEIVTRLQQGWTYIRV